MKRTDDFERRLEQMRMPNVLAGDHRHTLKQALLDQMQSRVEVQACNKSRPYSASRVLRIAAVSLVAIALTASGWGAEKVYEKIKRRYWGRETIFEQGWTAPGGQGMWRTGMVVGGAANDAESAAAQTRRHLDAVKKLIANKHYTFVRTFEAPGGKTQYLYQFEPPAGEPFVMNFSRRLDEFTSWEDYVQDVKQQVERRHQQIQKAMARGQFRLLDLDVFQVHLCRESDSGQKVDVQRIEMLDGKEIAVVSTHPAHEAKEQYEMEWKEHLEAIRAGERELLDLQLVRNYTYEITLADGSKTIFNYGGDAPLKQP